MESLKLSSLSISDSLEGESILSIISRVNGLINKMSYNALITLAKENNLSDAGMEFVLKDRLKRFYKKEILKECSFNDCIGVPCKYYVVIDFEATCEEKPSEDFVPEVIEFPAVLFDSVNDTVVDTFRSYCKPLLNPCLTSFCKKLTGIKQEDVDTAPLFTDVLKLFENWLKKHDLLSSENVGFITDGSKDFSVFLNVNCVLCKVSYPKWAFKWINLKKYFANCYKSTNRTLPHMVKALGLNFEGELHCGFDDAKNIANVSRSLVRDGVCLKPNECLQNGVVKNLTCKNLLLLNKDIKNYVPTFNKNSVLSKVNSLSLSLSKQIASKKVSD